MMPAVVTQQAIATKAPDVPNDGNKANTYIFKPQGITSQVGDAISITKIKKASKITESKAKPQNPGIISGPQIIPHNIKRTNNKILPSNKLHSLEEGESIELEDIVLVIQNAVFEALMPAHLVNKNSRKMKFADRQMIDLLESGLYVDCLKNDDGEIVSIKLYCSQDVAYKVAKLDLQSLIVSKIDEVNETNKKKSQDNNLDDKINHINIADNVICDVVLDSDLEKQSQFLKKKQKKEMDQVRKFKKKGRNSIREKSHPIILNSNEDLDDFVMSIIYVFKNYFFDGMGIDHYRNALGAVLGDNPKGGNESLTLDSILYNPETTIKNIVVQENEGNSKIVVKFISKDGTHSTIEFSKSNIESDGGDRNLLLNEIADYEATLNVDEID